MRKKIIFLIGVTTLLVLLSVLYYAGFFRHKGAGLLINTSPVANVYINGEHVGSTPFDEVQDPGEVEIRLVPESFETPLSPYETRVILESGIQTIIERDFAETENVSSGETVSFEKGPKNESSLVVASEPEGAQVEIDGVVKGFTPYKSTELTEGIHTIKVSSNQYGERVSDVKAQKGYKLTLFMKLAQRIQPEEDTSEESTNKQTIKILETPTGFLRVRSEPSTTSEELGRVERDEEFEIVSQSEDGLWIEIRYKGDESGWISKEYTTQLEQSTDQSKENNEE